MVIEKLCGDQVYQRALKRYGIDESTVKNLNGNESFVFSYSTCDKDLILKIIHSTHRSYEQIMAEVDWLQFLFIHGINVSLPTLSKNGHYVERINSRDSYFSAISYEKAKGQSLRGQHFHSNLLQNWGSTMGRLHHVSKDYRCPNIDIKRPEWHENKFLDIKRWIPSEFASIIHSFHSIYEKLRLLPTGINDYGLIHSDLHHRNFLLENNRITVIDFDDSEYSWFINDVAKTVYNETFNFSIRPKQRFKFMQNFLHHFMVGYLKENRIDLDWMKHFDDFLQFRHIFVFIRKYNNLNIGLSPSHDKIILVDRLLADFEAGIPILNNRLLIDTLKK